MLPESSDAHSDWPAPLRPSFVLRGRFARNVIRVVLMCLAWTAPWNEHAHRAACGEPFIQVPTSGDPSVSLDLPDSTMGNPKLDNSFVLPELTSPPRKESALNRIGGWNFWKRPDRRESWLSNRLRLVADEPDDPEEFPSEPDITEPGPDMGDYPNSAFTLPKGRAYIEFAPLTLQTGNSKVAGMYNFPYLLRYGITDDVELRLIGNGMTSVFSEGNTVSGFAPLLIDSKIHLWDDHMERFIPAASLEVYIQTNLASEVFQAGVQPSVNLNLDFPLTEETNIEMTIGYTGVQDTLTVFAGTRYDAILGHDVPIVEHTNVTVHQFSYQWAVEHAVTDKLEVFVQGYYNGAVYLQTGPGTVIGTGWFFKVSQQIMLFSSYNFGLDSSSPPFSTQLGMAISL